MNPLSISYSSPLLSSTRGKNDEFLEHMQYIEQQLVLTPKMLAKEKVSLSEQALALFRQKPATTSNENTQDNINEKLLKQIKAQIETLKRQLSRIKHEKNETTEQQRRQLQLQLATLNASLLDLLGKKLDAI